jgi:hypothetical protein
MDAAFRVKGKILRFVAAADPARRLAEDAHQLRLVRAGRNVTEGKDLMVDQRRQTQVDDQIEPTVRVGAQGREVQLAFRPLGGRPKPTQMSAQSHHSARRNQHVTGTLTDLPQTGHDGHDLERPGQGRRCR